MKRNTFPYTVILLAGVLLLVLSACGKVEDSIRNWGMRQRLARVERVGRGNAEKMERDLNLSRAKAKELERQMSALVGESRIRGRLSWQLARRFCQEGRYEAGAAYAQAAARGQGPDQAGSATTNLFERSLPLFKEALAHSQLEPNLLYEAGLCYANASRALGWEEDRLQTAIFLFAALQRLEPKGTRARYQLALLYGKTTNRSFRNPERAIGLLEQILREDDLNVPARFALAHIQAEMGEWNQALRQYTLIQEKLRDLHRRGRLPGSPERSQEFRRAVQNAEQLQICIQDRPGCTLQRVPR